MLPCADSVRGEQQRTGLADLVGRIRLELGAGGGLVGLAVALECDLQNPLLLTDQTEMFELMQHNIKLNGLQSKAKAMVLNWCVFLISHPAPTLLDATMLDAHKGHILHRREPVG